MMEMSRSNSETATEPAALCKNYTYICVITQIEDVALEGQYSENSSNDGEVILGLFLHLFFLGYFYLVGSLTESQQFLCEALRHRRGYSVPVRPLMFAL